MSRRTNFFLIILVITLLAYNAITIHVSLSFVDYMFFTIGLIGISYPDINKKLAYLFYIGFSTLLIITPLKIILSSYPEMFNALNSIALIIAVTTVLQICKQIEKKSKHDNLTGLFNRQAIVDKLKSLMTSNKLLAIAIIDIDYFKSVNDTFGHQAGDFALQQFATKLMEHRQPGTFVGRLSGEEFLFVISSKSDINVYEYVNKFRNIIDEWTIKMNEEDEINFTISSGVAYYTNEDESEILRKADDKLYEAKENGRNKVVGK